MAALNKPLVIDFRGVQEEKNNPSELNFEQKSAPTIEPKVTDLLRKLNEVDRSKKIEIDKIFQQAYRKYTIENIGTFEEFSKLFDNPDSTIMFHCTAGKDRTGFASALILSLFGVANKTIIDDYFSQTK